MSDNLMEKKIKIKVSKPWIAFPGSTIQQNYGESVENHGYLLWDIKSKNDFNVEFYKIKNDHPFVTIDWTTIDEAKKEILTYPPQSRIRIKSKNYINQKETSEINSFLKERGALEIIYKTEGVSKKIIEEESKKLINDIRNIDELMTYMRKYASSIEIEFNEEDWNNIENIVRNTIKNIEIDNDLPRHIKWSLKNCEWDNLYSYGEKNYIDFTKLNGIIGVLGPNRSGKSSLVGTLTYSLFNSTDRGAIKNVSVVNENKLYGCSKTNITTTNGDFYIERITTKKENKKGEINAATNLNFFKKENNDLIDLNGEQRNDTEKNVRKTLGTFDDFIMTGLSKQGDLNRFINEGSTQRKTILTKFLDLDFIEKLFEVAKSEYSNIKYTLSNYNSNYSALIEELNIKINEIKNKILIEENSLASYKINMDKLKNHYSLLTQGMRVVSQDEINRQKDIVEKYTKLISSKTQENNKIKTSIKELFVKKEKIDSLNKSYDLNSLKEEYQNQINIENRLLSTKVKYEKELDILKQKEKSIKRLLEVPCGDQYPTCKFIKDSHIDKKTFNEQKLLVEESLKIVDDMQKLLGEKIKLNTKDKITKLEKLKETYSTICIDIVNKEKSIISYDNEIKIANEKLIDNNIKLDELVALSQNDFGKESEKIKNEIFTIENNFKKIDKNIRELVSANAKLEHELNVHTNNKKNSENIFYNAKLYEFITNSLSKKGIPSIILRSQLPIINQEIEKILRNIVEFSVEFELDDDSNFMDIYINYGKSKRLIELCSGMEKTIASIAIRVALSNITTLPKPDFFILDEGFGTLDAYQLEACGRLLQSLKNYFKFVIVITHVDFLKDYVDTTIEIEKRDNNSYVYCD